MEREKLNFIKIATFLVGVLAVLGIVCLLFLAKNYKYIGNNQQKTITVVGNSKIYVTPDVSTISFTIRHTSSTSKESQTLAAKDMEAVSSKIKSLGVAEKDIKTSSYSVYPKYNYPSIACVRYPCDTSKPVLEGYETSETVEIKIRDLDNVGKVIDAVTTSGIGEVNGPNFVVDDIEKVKSEARAAAIEDAKSKAKVLAKQLGVGLDDIVYFADNQAVSPAYYAYDRGMKSEAVANAGAMPNIAVGEQETNYSVSITYEID